MKQYHLVWPNIKVLVFTNLPWNSPIRIQDIFKAVAAFNHHEHESFIPGGIRPPHSAR
jgi:hypothetical protein